MTSPATPSSLLRSRFLARNAIWNVFGSFAPLVVAVFAIPVLTRALGANRFGILTLAWVLVGYFSLFDFGLGRALTQAVAEKIGQRDTQSLVALFWTALLLLLAFGIISATLLVIASPLLVRHVLHVPVETTGEAIRGFRIVGLALPFVIVTSGLRGFLEAHQSFKVVNAIRFPMGVFTYLAPLLVLPFTHSIDVIMATLVVGRILSCFAFVPFCFRTLPRPRRPQISRTVVRPLFSVGIWMTFSNIVGPVLSFVDRFVIGALGTLAAVAYYSVPAEVTNRLLIAPVAITAVMFPAFSTAIVHDSEHAARLLNRTTRFTFLLMFPVALFLVLFAHAGLQFWLGTTFERNGGASLQWLSVSLLVSSLALCPYTFLQGIGRADITVKCQLCELPVYALLLWFGVRHFGISGAAGAAAIRSIIDAILLFLAAHRVSPAKPFSSTSPTSLLLFAGGAFALAVIPAGTLVKVAVFLLGCALFAIVAWANALENNERQWVLSVLSRAV